MPSGNPKGSKPTRLETCPDCGDEFVGSPYHKGSTSTWWKKCPACGAENQVGKLQKRPHTLAHHLRSEGLSDNHLESLEIALKAMLAATDRLMSQLPAGAPGRAQVEALFRPSVQLARELVALPSPRFPARCLPATPEVRTCSGRRRTDPPAPTA